jgi:hypothetical protein
LFDFFHRGPGGRKTRGQDGGTWGYEGISAIIGTIGASP